MVSRGTWPQAECMLDVRRNGAPANDRGPALPERSSMAYGPLPRATESLMRAAAAVRRSSGHRPEMSDVGHSLEHVEEALDDLSAGMARLAMALDEVDASPGGVAWRLRTLHHALRAARDLSRDTKALARARPAPARA